MDFQSPLDNQAARSALVSTGVVGLTAALVQKVWGKGPKVSLPIGVATALALDYAQKRYRNHASVRTMNSHSWNYMHKQVEEKAQSWVDRSWYEEQMTMAWVALGGAALAGAYKFYGYMQGVRDIVVRNTAPTVVSALVNTLPLVASQDSIIQPPRNDGPPQTFDARKAQSNLKSTLVTIGVIYASLDLLMPDQIQSFANYLADLFIDYAIQPLTELFSDPPQDPHVLHERMLRICENAQGAVLTQMCEAERNRDLQDEEKLPEVPNIVGIVEDHRGERVAMTIDADGAREVPLVHIDEQLSNQLMNQYSANVEPGDPITLQAPPPSVASQLSPDEIAAVRAARQRVMSAPVGDTTLGGLIRQTVDDVMSQPLPADLNDPAHNRLLSNGRTVRQMILQTTIDDQSPGVAAPLVPIDDQVNNLDQGIAVLSSVLSSDSSTAPSGSFHTISVVSDMSSDGSAPFTTVPVEDLPLPSEHGSWALGSMASLHTVDVVDAVQMGQVDGATLETVAKQTPQSDVQKAIDEMKRKVKLIKEKRKQEKEAKKKGGVPDKPAAKKPPPEVEDGWD